MPDDEGVTKKGCCGACKLRTCVGVVGITALTYALGTAVISVPGTLSYIPYVDNELHPNWLFIVTLVGSICLAVAAGVLTYAVCCGSSVDEDTSPGCVLGFFAYTASWATVLLLINIVVAAMAMIYMPTWKASNKKTDENVEVLTTEVAIGCVITLLAFVGLMYCSWSVYKYYDYIRPMAVYDGPYHPMFEVDVSCVLGFSLINIGLANCLVFPRKKQLLENLYSQNPRRRLRPTANYTPIIDMNSRTKV